MTRVEDLLDDAQDLVERGGLEEADRQARAALALLEGKQGPRADELRCEGQMVLAEVALLRWEIERAEELLAVCQPPRSMRAEVLYRRAVVAELQGRADLADRWYDQAARLDPQECRRPVRMDDAEARQMLEDLVRAFPDDVRAALESVAIEIVDVPDRAVDGGPDTDPLLLGLYHGVPLGDKTSTPLALPDRVRIFKRNIERMAVDPGELREQLRITLLHEVGHHLGWDEDDLEERGLQ